jgi:hypothetical protein
MTSQALISPKKHQESNRNDDDPCFLRALCTKLVPSELTYMYWFHGCGGGAQ